MVSLKLWLRSFHRQSIFIFLSFSLIITIILCDILQIPNTLSIILKSILFLLITLWLELWFSTWGRVLILSISLLLVASQVNPNRSPDPLLLVHITLLLVIMFFFDRRETRKRLLHQRRHQTMQALLRQNPPLTQTVDYTGEAVILLDNTGLVIELNSQSSYLLSLPESCLIGKPLFEVLGILPNFNQTTFPRMEILHGKLKKEL